MDGVMDWIDRLLDGSLFAGGIFLVIGVVGALLLLVSLVLDGIFDAFDFGDGPLSLTTIAAFTSIFGFTAFAGVGAGLSTPIASVLGALAGILGGALAWWLTRLIRGAESSTSVSGSDLVGSEAAVVLAIPAGGLGEVALIRHGERVSLSATADTAIPRGAAVRVVQIITATSVRVEAILPSEPRPTVEPQGPGDPSWPAPPSPDRPQTSS
ncbi:hypothetical protein JD276_10740 [Leucobacter sp. CSA1]|uniref:NfeD-like C-terminal domain-containing protein n=1 Tax=Leucobacter chromiisoli TaxID=2796471 RepID=A0A934UV44_9MICO|nr:hypothetical protein [Leucobacter chromiisoli]MBK0419510.1 hypothetical protein [Leucobacter chromiisoli]